MQKTTWMMLLILSLPLTHPARRGAVEELAQRLAELHWAQADERRRS